MRFIVYVIKNEKEISYMYSSYIHLGVIKIFYLT